MNFWFFLVILVTVISFSNAFKWQDDMLALVNKLRAENTVNPLCMNSKLNAVSAKFSQELQSTGQFSHIGQDGSLPDARIAREGFQAKGTGENLFGAADTNTAFQEFFKSPKHKENMINPAFTHIGIGTTSTSDEPTGDWVLAFAGSDIEACSISSRPGGTPASPSSTPALAGANPPATNSPPSNPPAADGQAPNTPAAPDTAAPASGSTPAPASGTTATGGQAPVAAAPPKEGASVTGNSPQAEAAASVQTGAQAAVNAESSQPDSSSSSASSSGSASASSDGTASASGSAESSGNAKASASGSALSGGSPYNAQPETISRFTIPGQTVTQDLGTTAQLADEYEVVTNIDNVRVVVCKLSRSDPNKKICIEQFK